MPIPKQGGRHSSPAIAYILLRFPHLTETFIAEEIRAVQAHGGTVRIYSLLRPKPGPVHPTSRELSRYVEYAPAVHHPSLWLAQVYFLLRSPGLYLRLLWRLMSRPAPRAAWRLKRLLVFWKGVALARRLLDVEVDVIHAHFAWLAAAAAMTISQLRGRPFTVTAHAADIYSPESDLLCLVAGAAARVITISEHNRQTIAARCPRVPPERLTVIHCGIDRERFRPPTRTPSRPPLRIISVGSLVEKKGHEYLVRACRLLKERGLDFHCTIVGWGDPAPLRRLSAALGVADLVTLAGPRGQPWVYDALRRSHIFVLACVVAQNGDRDGIPVAMMEALALKVPVISTPVSGVPELVRDGETGLLVPQRDAPALAEAILRLAEDEPLRRRLGENGAALVAHEFDVRENGRRLLAALTAVGQTRP